MFGNIIGFFDFGTIDWTKVDSELGIVLAFLIAFTIILGYQKKNQDKAWKAVENSWNTIQDITTDYRDFIEKQTAVLTSIHERMETNEIVTREVREAVKACPQKCGETVTTLQLLVDVLKENAVTKIRESKKVKKPEIPDNKGSAEFSKVKISGNENNGKVYNNNNNASKK